MKLIRLKEVMSLTTMSKTTIYTYINKDKFPKPIPLGERAVAWVESEVQEWIEERIAGRA